MSAIKPLVLVACCGEKLAAPALARDLYRSDLFVKARAWAETFGRAWWILSAGFGLVHPSTRMAPYNLTLGDLEPAEMLAWEQGVAGRVDRVVQFHGASPVVVLAGRAYRGWCEGRGYFTPLAHLGIGEQKQWLKRCVDQGTAELETSLTLNAPKDTTA